MMKRFAIVALCAMVFACSSNSSTCTKTPTQTSKCDETLVCGQALTCVDDLLYPTTCGPSNCDEPLGPCPPEPKAEILWQTFDATTRDMLADTGYCALFYFGSSTEGLDEGSAKMEKTFEDQEVVELINDAFIPVIFPVDECLKDPSCMIVLAKDLDVTTFPTTVLVFKGEDSVTLLGEGYMNVEEFKSFILKKKDEYDECKSLKAGVNE